MSNYEHHVGKIKLVDENFTMKRKESQRVSTVG